VKKLGNKKILLIEEDYPTRKTITNFLKENCGYEVIQAADDIGGIKAFVTDFPDLVIMDIDAGMKDGQVIKFVKRNQKKVIAISGKRELEALVKNAGCDGFLTKPFHLLLLQNLVEKVFGQIDFST
jgi:DNA-binding response OmpR family regulator